MKTFKEEDREYLEKRYDKVIEMLEWLLELLNRPQKYDRDRVIVEVEHFLKQIG